MEWIVVGIGRVGSALVHWLDSAGTPARQVISHRGLPTWLKRLPQQSPAGILLAVSDDALPQLARQLAAARADWRGWCVLHTSGTRPAKVLAPLARRGASVASMHPMMTITRTPPSPLGVIFSIEGDAAACRAARSLIRCWHGRVLVLTPEAKAAYHLAATLVGPGAVVNFATAEAMLAHAGLSGERWRIARSGLTQLLRATAHNIDVAGTRPAFTGPWARRDRATIALQCSRVPDRTLQKLYDALTRASEIIPAGRNKKS